MERFNGIAASRGVAIGKLHFFDNCQRPVQLARSDSPERELERFESARLRALKTLDDLHTQAVERVGPEDSMIFGVQQALLNDRDYISGVRDLINQEHYVAEYAVQRTGERLAQMISQLDNVYLQERSSDLLDISGRVVRQLNGELARDLSDIQGQVVLAAQDLLPSETVQLDQSKVQAFVTGGGSRTSHASILSRTMGIPAVVGLQEQLSQLRNGALVVVDIDHFKQVNDRWGHPQGDAALQRVAALLKENFREGDILGRPGGDEFLAYLPGTIGPEALGQKCAALCRRVEETVLENGGRITVSVGAALALPQEGYAALYRRADQALYAAKAQGRNGWTVAPREKEAT